MQYKTYTCRAYPNKTMAALLDLTFVMCRKMFNTLLNIELSNYSEFISTSKNCFNRGEFVDEKKFSSSHKFPSLKKLKLADKNYKKVDSLALCAEYSNMVRGMELFYRGYCKKPKFKGRNDKDSYTTSCVNNNIRILGSKIRLPKYGFVKVRGLRQLPDIYEIKRATVFKSKIGKYYISLVVKIQDDITSNEELSQKQFATGLDFKIGDIFVSNNNFIPHYSNKYFNLLDKVSIFQKNTNRKKRFSKNYWKSTNKLRKLHRIIVNIRNDFIHKLTFYLSLNFKFVIIENLSITEIVYKLGRGKNAYNTSFFKFVKKLTYKMNGRVVKIDKWFPSSKKCSICGKKKKHLKLSQRTYRCAFCGNVIDRDLNAAINILNEGLRLLHVSN